jgi:lycopene cyclase domain-containing protein
VTGLGYTVPAAASVAAVCGWELAVLRTGLFRRPSYWAALAIVLAVQIPVDGWLTKRPASIVRYAPGQITGLRFPWDIPVEDFLYGFALVTAALLLWERAAPAPGAAGSRGSGHATGVDEE